MTQRNNTGIEPKTSVELVDDLRAADLSDLCDAAELAITDGGGFQCEAAHHDALPHRVTRFRSRAGD